MKKCALIRKVRLTTRVYGSRCGLFLSVQYQDSLRAESVASLRRIGKLILLNDDRALCSIYIQVKQSIARDTGLGILKLIEFLSLRGVLEHPEHPPPLPPGYATDSSLIQHHLNAVQAKFLSS